jgi:Ring finger domain
MRPSARQRRARAERIQAAVDEDARRAHLVNNTGTTIDQSDQLQQSELYEFFQRDQQNFSNHNSIRSADNVSISQEQEILGMIDVLDTLLADPYLSEIELNDILSQHAEYLHQLETLQQHEILQPDGQYSEFYNEEGSSDVWADQQFEDQLLEEQIREIEDFELMQRQNEMFRAAAAHMLTERNPPRVAPPVVHRHSNRNRSFKGYILNPNQDDTSDDSTNTHRSTSETQLSSPGSSTTILSADFGDDDVLPIEETSCVICCVDYRHGDDIVRNANSCGNNSICNHVFHTKCITSWVESSGKSDCPCCRSPFALEAST